MEVISPFIVIFYFIPAKYENKIVPYKTKTTIGSNAILNCDSASFTIWFFKPELPNNAGPIGKLKNILFIKNVTLANDGLYKCYGRVRANDDFFISEAILVVYGKCV